MKVKTILLSAAFALLIAQCNQYPLQTDAPTDPRVEHPDNENISFSHLSPDVLIELPSCIATDPFAKKGLEKTAFNARPDGKIYDAIRKYMGYANTIVNNDVYGVKAQIQFWKDTIDWKQVREAAPTPVTGFLGNLVWTAVYFPDRELHYQLTVALNKDGAQPSSIPPLPTVFTINFNGNFDYPKGRVYYHLGGLDLFPSDSLEVEVIFEKYKKGGRSLHVNITGFAPEYAYDPDKLTLSLYKKNGFIHMSGSSWHPKMEGIIRDVKGHCYTFTGIVDPPADKSIINLGLPPASYDDTLDLFTIYGLGNVWTSMVIEQEVLALSDSIKSIIATSYIESLTVDTILKDTSIQRVPPEEILKMTVEDFKFFLDLNQSISNPDIRANLNELLWVANVAQPIYFNYLGYVGNGSNVPIGFDYLNNVGIMPNAKVPVKTAELTIEP